MSLISIFLSYARGNSTLAGELEHALQASGVEVWAALPGQGQVEEDETPERVPETGNGIGVGGQSAGQ